MNVCPNWSIETNAFQMHVYDNGIQLWPPPEWIIELVGLIQNGIISNTAAKTVIQLWREDTAKKIIETWRTHLAIP